MIYKTLRITENQDKFIKQKAKKFQITEVEYIRRLLEEIMQKGDNESSKSV